MFLAVPCIKEEFTDASIYQTHVQTFQKDKTSAVITELRQNSGPWVKWSLQRSSSIFLNH